MNRNTRALTTGEFDVLVIGAGITGAWIALDCVQRGLRVAIIDRSDFGAETSAKSSKLLHGGIRYLQQFHFGRVRESARERSYFHQVAPHLSHFIPFLVPTFHGVKKGRLFMACGMVLYRLICAGIETSARKDKRAPPIHYLNRKRLLEIVPVADNHMTGAYVLPESHMYNSERMTLAIVKTAVEGGAVAANYVCADNLIIENSNVRGVVATDIETGKPLRIHSRITINSTGPWLSRLASSFENSAAQTITTGFSVGSHLVTRQLISDYAIALPTEFRGDNLLDRGGRHIFILPWRGCSLVGTSYVPAHDGIDHLQLQPQEVEQLIGSIQRILPDLRLTEKDILFSFSGIYPLQTTDINQSTYQGTGDYQIIDHRAQDGILGFISSLGAKFTTARKVASNTVDLALDHLGHKAGPCISHRLPLSGGDIRDVDQYLHDKQVEYAELFGEELVAHLVRQYGTETDHIARLCSSDPALSRTVGSGRKNILAEIVYAIENEMCCHLDDLLYRRTGIATIGYPGDEIVTRCADLMAARLDWKPSQRQQEIDNVRALSGYSHD